MPGVFLSYAREDMAFVRILHDALAAAGRQPAWDQDHAVVPFSALYQEEIKAAIIGSDKFVFVISPDSLDSEPCAEEIGWALEAGKQIVTLLRRPARPEQVLPEVIAKRNWIFFDEDASFDQHFAELLQVLDTDLDFAKTHRQLQVRATEWAASGSDRARQLRGRDLRAAETWLAGADAHQATPPTAIQRQYIAASRRGADRTARIQRTILTSGLAITVALATTAFVQRGHAISERNLAVYNLALAEAGQLSATDTSVAADLYLAAYRMRPTQQALSRLISMEAWPLARTVRASDSPIDAVAVTPDGRTLAIGSFGGADELWSVTASGQPRRLAAGISLGTGPVAISPDGREMAAGTALGQVQLWDIADPGRPVPQGPPIGNSTPGSPSLYSVSFSTDGRTLAIGGPGALSLWDVGDPVHPRLDSRPPVGNAGIYSLAFSRYTAVLAVGTSNGTVALWNVADPSRPVPIGSALGHADQGDPVYSVAFSPDGSTLAAGDAAGLVQLWNVANPADPGELQPLLAGSGNVSSLAFSPGGAVLAAGDVNGAIQLWNVADPNQPEPLGPTLTAGGSPVQAVAFGQQGSTLVSGGNDGTIQFWNLPSRVIVTNGQAYSVAFSPASNTLAYANSFGVVSLAQVTSGAIQARGLIPVLTPVTAMQFSPHGTVLAVAGADVELWNVADPAKPVSYAGPLTASIPPPTTSPTSPTAGSPALYAVAFSPNGRDVALGYSDGDTQLWNVANPRQPTPVAMLLGSGPDLALAFSPDGRTLAASDATGHICLWNLARLGGDDLPEARLTAAASLVPAVAFSPDGGVLASGDANGQIQLWNVAELPNVRRLATLQTQGASIHSIAFGPGGMLAAAGDAGTISRWDVADARHPEAIGLPLSSGTAAVYSVALSPGGQYLASASADGVRIWSLSADAAVDWICTASNGLTAAEWRQYIPQLPYEPLCRR